MVGIVITVAFFTWLAWKAGAVVLSGALRVMAWILVVAVVLSVVLGLSPVPGAVLEGIVVFGLAGHAVFRVRRGHWRSPTLQRFADLLQERSAHN